MLDVKLGDVNLTGSHKNLHRLKFRIIQNGMKSAYRSMGNAFADVFTAYVIDLRPRVVIHKTLHIQHGYSDHRPAMCGPRITAHCFRCILQLSIVVLYGHFSALVCGRCSHIVACETVWNIRNSAHCTQCTLVWKFYGFISSWNSYQPCSYRRDSARKVADGVVGNLVLGGYWCLSSHSMFSYGKWLQSFYFFFWITVKRNKILKI